MEKTPQEKRAIRLKNDYQEMKNIRGRVIEWKVVKGNPPYVEEYEITVNVRSIIGEEPKHRDQHVLRITLPPSYPLKSAPKIKMVSKPYVYHPNWYPDGAWCYGKWAYTEGLGHHIVRMIKTLQYDPEITHVKSSANPLAKEWYIKEKKKHEKWFPCDTRTLPDPLKKRFAIKHQSRRAFKIKPSL